MKKFTKAIAIILILVVLTTALSGCSDILQQLLYPNNSAKQQAERILGYVLDNLTQNYVEELSDEQLGEIVVAGANAMMGYYDKYGFLMTPEEYYDFNNPTSTVYEGEYFGFTYVQYPFLGMHVVEIATDSNAYGELMIDDIIVKVTHVDGTPLTYTSEGVAYSINARTSTKDEILAAMKNVTQIKVQLYRGGTYENCFEDGELIELVLTKGIVHNENAKGYEFVEYYFGADNNNVSDKTIQLRELNRLDGTDVGYIRIIGFGKIGNTITDTASEVTKALDIMKKAGKKTLLLDLKGNPGGNAMQCKDVASNFVYDENAPTSYLTIATMKDRNQEEKYSARSKYNIYFDTAKLGTQIVVATDEGSASASELLLGAMLDYGTCVQIGTTSYGKGIAQYIESIPVLGDFERDGKTITYNYAVYYTSSYYYSPKGKNIHGIGFTPNNENIATNYNQVITRTLELIG